MAQHTAQRSREGGTALRKKQAGESDAAQELHRNQVPTEHEQGADLGELVRQAQTEGRGSLPVRSASIQRLQQACGNRAVQRLLQPAQRWGPQEEDATWVPASTQGGASRPAATITAWKQGEKSKGPATSVQGKPVQRSAVLVQRLETGIAKGKAIGSFVTSVKQVQSNWKSLSPNARAAALAKPANDKLKEAGVPPCNVSVEDLGSDSGQFDFVIWTLKIGKGPISETEVTDAKMADIADTIYHESRHAEQWFRIARQQAGEGKSAKQLQNDLGIPADIAKKAAANPLKASSIITRKFMSKVKIAEEDQEIREAKAWYDSIYGANAAHRNKTLGEMEAKGDAVVAARAKVKKARGEVAAKLADKDKKAKEYNDKLKIDEKKAETLKNKLELKDKEKAKLSALIKADKLAAKKGTNTEEDLTKIRTGQETFKKSQEAVTKAEKEAKKAHDEAEAAKKLAEDADEAYVAAVKAQTTAEKKSKRAIKENKQNYEDYRALAEEKDAWKVGGDVTAAYLK